MFSRDPEPTGNRRSSVDKAKPFDIPKREVWEAFKKVKVNQGAAGVDGQSVAGFEADLSNRFCQGSGQGGISGGRRRPPIGSRPF